MVYMRHAGAARSHAPVEDSARRAEARLRAPVAAIRQLEAEDGGITGAALGRNDGQLDCAKLSVRHDLTAGYHNRESRKQKQRSDSAEVRAHRFTLTR